MMSERLTPMSLPEVVAGFASTLRYRPADGSIVLGGMESSTVMTVICNIPGEDEREFDDLVGEATAGFVNMGAIGFAVFGFGENGRELAERATAIANARAKRLCGGRPGSAPDVRAVVAVADGECELQRSGGGWTPLGAVPDLSAQRVLEGNDAAENIDAHDAWFVPDKTPSWGVQHLPDFDEVERMSGLEQTTAAMRALDRLALGTSDSREHDTAMVCAMVLRNKHVENLVVARAANDERTAGALHTAWVTSPPRFRDAVAGPAAIAQIVRHGNGRGARLIAESVDPGSPVAGLSNLVQTGLRLTLTPTEWRRFVAGFEEHARAGQQALMRDAEASAADAPDPWAPTVDPGANGPAAPGPTR